MKFLVMIALALTMTTGSIEAQQKQCAPRDKVIERLTTAYGESRQSIGLAANNTTVEVFASAETGSWTITVTNPEGDTCLVASGSAFESTAGRKNPR